MLTKKNKNTNKRTLKEVIIYFFNDMIVKLGSRNLIPITDENYLKVLHRLKKNQKLNLQNPQTFSEKIQWLKLYDRKSEYTQMVDKYDAKKYVANVIGEQYIIPTIEIYDKFDDIDFEKLPNRFVIKCTHDSGGIVVCNDKNKLNIAEAKNKINKAMKKSVYYALREWPYKNVKPRIIIEKNMTSKEQEELIDYKFYCFNGKPKFMSISEGMSNHSTAKLSFMDMDFKLEEFYRKDYQRLLNGVKPINFEKMKELASELSKNMTFLRVDFYEINKKIYFGELTFYPSSGFTPFQPEEYNKILGDMIELPKEKCKV